jgi:RND superfamily putative drug exporter
MDYEVFILSRIREEYQATGSTPGAVVAGLGHTGRLVSSAALILALAFLAMSSAPATAIKSLATGLGAGILIDATIIRCLLVPALVALFGRWNWWLPARPVWLRKRLPSPAADAGTARAPHRRGFRLVAARPPAQPGRQAAARRDGG